MPRQKNAKATSIYWLVDARPETLKIWPSGLPFYCGKTTLKLRERVYLHESDARKLTKRPSAIRVRECGANLRIHCVAVIGCDDDWVAAEKRWITVLRSNFPGCVNVTSGGQGAPGNLHSAATRQKISAAKKGKTKTAEHRAKLSAANMGKPMSPERRAKMSAGRMGKPLTALHRANLSAARKGIVFTPEHRANMIRALTGRKLSPEHKAKILRRGKVERA